MFSHRVVTIAALAGMVALAAQPARAQSKPQLAKHRLARQQLSGQVTGVCMLSQSQVLSQSEAGQAFEKRMNELAKQANDAVVKLRDPLQRDIQKFRQDAQNMQPQQREDKQKELQKRMQDFQQEGEIFNERLRLTRARALNRIGAELNPLVSAIYKQHGCGVLLNRDMVLGGNMPNDLTSAVIAALDKKMPSISFNLASLPQRKSGK